MSSRFRISAIAAPLHPARRLRPRDAQRSAAATGTPAIASSPDTVFPGNASAARLDPRAAAYEGNAPAIAKGQQLFMWMNCAGCHSHGGGGMGPALMDGKWRYGGRIDQIASSISEGRPNGMPSWRSKLTQDQIWQLAAYVRSLAGHEPIDARQRADRQHEQYAAANPDRAAGSKPADSDQQ